MTNRYGPNSYDCSSAVFYALIEAGFLPKGTAIESTESLSVLEGSLLQRILRLEVRRGNIFISGGRGTSAGANGNTGVFVSNSKIIHFNYGTNGIAETTVDGGDMGGPPNDFFRLKGATQEETKPANKGAEIIMQCIYWKPSKVDEGANFVYYFNGANCSYISNGDSIKILKQIYKDNNGKDMPEDAWTYDAPCFSRLEAVVPVL